MFSRCSGKLHEKSSSLRSHCVHAIFSLAIAPQVIGFLDLGRPVLGGLLNAATSDEFIMAYAAYVRYRPYRIKAKVATQIAEAT